MGSHAPLCCVYEHWGNLVCSVEAQSSHLEGIFNLFGDLISKACWRLTLTSLMQIPGFCYECYTHDQLDSTLLGRCFRSFPRLFVTGLFLGAHFALWSWAVENTSLTHSLLFVSSGPLIIVARSTLIYLLSFVYARQRRRVCGFTDSPQEFQMEELNRNDQSSTGTNDSDGPWWRKLLNLSTYISPDSYPPTILEFVGTLVGFSGAALLVLKSTQDRPAENEVPVSVEGDFAAFLGALMFVLLLDAGSVLRQWMPLFVYTFPVTFIASISRYCLSIYGADNILGTRRILVVWLDRRWSSTMVFPRRRFGCWDAGTPLVLFSPPAHHAIGSLCCVPF